MNIRVNSFLINFLVIFWALPVAIGARPSGTTANEPPKKRYSLSDTTTIMEVLDGDTFIISGGRHLRLIGVDTPEKGEPVADWARSFADSVLRGKQIRIETDRVSEDRYGRLLAYVYYGSDCYNELILKRGLARVYIFKENQKHNKALITAQNSARKSKQGIWSLPVPAAESYYIAAGGSYRFHRPLCPLIKNINIRKAKRFRTRDAALDVGLSPCRDCRP